MKTSLAACCLLAASLAGCGGNASSEDRARGSVFGAADGASTTVDARAAAPNRADSGAHPSPDACANGPDACTSGPDAAGASATLALDASDTASGETGESDASTDPTIPDASGVASTDPTRDAAAPHAESPDVGVAAPIRDAGPTDATAPSAVVPLIEDAPGGIRLRTQADVEALRGLTTVYGSLWITGHVTDLSPLESLSKITDTLYVSEAYDLETLHGLENLTELGGDLFIESMCDWDSTQCYGNPKLQNTDALNHLAIVGGEVRIEEYSYHDEWDRVSFRNDSLESIGLNALISAARITIRGNPALVTLGFNSLATVPGGVDIMNNRQLTTLTGFGALTATSVYLGAGPLTDFSALAHLTSTNSLSLAGKGLNLDVFGTLVALESLTLSDPGLTVLHGLANLVELGSLEISNSKLSDLHGLEGLTALGSLRLSNNQLLTSLDGLENLTLSESLSLDNLPQLTSLDGIGQVSSVQDVALNLLPQLTSLGALASISDLTSLSLQGCAALADFSGLGGLNTVNQLNLDNLPLLQDLDWLSHVTQVDTLIVSSNAALSSLAGLSGIAELETLNIAGNPALVTLQGLNNLERCEFFEIRGNQSLTELRALSSLESVEKLFSVASNSSLPTCEAELLSARLPPNPSYIYGNDDAGICIP